MTIGLQAATVQIRGFQLSDLEARRIERRLRRIYDRLADAESQPRIDLTIEWHPLQRRAKSHLVVREGHLGRQLVASASAGTADQAVRFAAERVERQLARRVAVDRGQPSYGVPSRRFPERSRERYRRRPVYGGDEAGDMGVELDEPA